MTLLRALISLFLFSSVSYAQEPTEIEMDSSSIRRGESRLLVLANYSPFDLMIPNKIGLTLGYIQSADTTWEFEYLGVRVSAIPFVIDDLGTFDEQRISLLGRSYLGNNSFHVSYGLSYFDFSAHLGSRFLDTVAGEDRYSVDLVRLQSLGLNFAIGNRWTFNRNITFGVDWVTWAQPFYVINTSAAFLDKTTDQSTKNDVETALKLASFLPRIVFLKMQLGISF